MIWWVIVFGGVGTYMMRSAGVWIPGHLFPTRWLSYLPLAVILVLTVNSIYSFRETVPDLVGAIAATSVVILASQKKLPLVLCIVLGCVVFGGILEGFRFWRF